MLLACLPMPAAGQAQAPSSGIFTTLRTELVPDIGVALEPATMRRRVVGVDTQQVTAARLGQETLRLNLFDDAAVSVQIDRVRPTRSGYFITGRPQGFEWGEVRLIVNGPVMAGTVVSPEGKFTIRYGGSGRHVIRKVDPSLDALEDDVVERPLPAGPPQTILPDETLPGAPQALAPGDPFGAVLRPATDAVQDRPTEDGSEIRVLVVYTPALQREQGGAAGIQAVIDLMIASANQAFEAGGIDPRVVLAHAAMVDYVETDRRDDLNRLTSPDDGYLDDVHALRNEHAADLVHLLTGGLRFADTGIANGFREASLQHANVAAFALTQGTSEVVFTHEIGHNFGLVHDRFVDHAATTPIFPYAFGYVNDRAFEPGAPPSARWRTVMTYPDECGMAGFHCQQLLRFSNPDQSYEGDPLGVFADDPRTGIDGPADARLTINRTARWVGSFRSEACTQFAVSPQALVVPVGGADVGIRVDTPVGCLWGASSESAFLAREPELRQAGSGRVSIRVEPNETGAERNASVTVAGTTVELRQLAVDAGICSRAFGVVRAIAGDVPCDEIGDRHLSEVTSLLVQDQGLTALKAEDFEGLSNLTSLMLDNNDIGELPEDLFGGLSKLTRLTIGDNRLTELPAGLFAGLSKLRDLSLRGNGLQSLPEGVFSGLSALQRLTLADNELAEIPEGAFAELAQLTSLHLQNNSLSELSPDTFAGPSFLAYLDLSGNSYESLPSGLFAHPRFLRRLFLASDKLSSLPEGLFAGLRSMQTLSIQNSPLTELPPGVFSDLRRLETLIVHHTVMPSLPEGVFSGLTALEQLRLRWNELETLPSGVFAELGKLRRIDLADNRLSSLPDAVFSGLTSLDTLLLQGNPGDPFRFELTLEKVGDHQLKAVAPLGAPFELELPLGVSSGAEVGGGVNAITIPAGSVASAPVTATRIEEDVDTATVDIATLPAVPSHHGGYVFEKNATLPIELALPQDVAPPAQVTGIAIARGAKSLQVSWTPIAGADGYKVQWKSGDEDYDDEARQAVVDGGDTAGYTITGLTDGAEYTVRVLATRAITDDGPFSEEVSGTTRSGDPDVNGDGVLDSDDAQIMYYAYRFASLVGDGETGGTEASRQRFLGGFSGLDDPTDEDLRAMVARANAWRTEGLAEGGDINADGTIDDLDARAMHRAYRYESLLGDGEEGGAERFRLQLLGPLAGKPDPTDEELKAMLRRANELRKAYG